MKPERVQRDRPSSSQILVQEFQFPSPLEATRFIGRLGDIPGDDQRFEVDLRGGQVTVRLAPDGGSELTSRETAVMERIRGMA